MTERLYFTNSYQHSFSATVIQVQEKADQALIQLDRTCFYPTSGGQLFDKGQLADLAIADVFVDEAGNVQHVVELNAHRNAQPSVGAIVSGRVDWSRRYDHMQQHSGQHLLSQVLFQNYAIETVAVHFGEIESTVDLDVADLTADQIATAECRSSELIYAALPIRAYFVNDQEVGQIPLRRPPKVTGTIRIVEIDQFDYSACGGTHVRTTAEIGPLKITKVERRRSQVRLTFLCGLRAYHDYVLKHRLITEAAALFSNEIQQVPALIARNLATIKEKERALEESQEILLSYEAKTMVENAEVVGEIRVVQYVAQGSDANTIKSLASQLQSYPNVVALLATFEGEKATVCFACDPALTVSDQLNVGQLLRTLLQPLGGKGGGKADFAQGGVAPEQVPALLTATHQQLQKLLNH